MNKPSAALLIDLTRSPSPKPIQPISSPSFEIPGVYQQLRARKLRRFNRFNPSRPLNPSIRHPRDTSKAGHSNNASLNKHGQLQELLQATVNGSPDQITLCSDQIDLTLDDENFKTVSNTATLTRRPGKLTTRLSPRTRCSEPIDLTLEDEDSVTTQKNQPATLAQDANLLVSLRESSPHSSSSSSTCDAELVESILLDRPPLVSERPKSPPPLRFLPSDLNFLNIYLCKPIARVLTTCSSIIIPPQPVPGFPINHLEKMYCQDDWRIRRETISCPGPSSRNVDCWISGSGWPAKSFIICGWLVGIDRREKFLSYHVDDGTAVLECQVLVSQLNKVFDLSSENISKITGKDEKQLATASDEASLDRVGNQPPPKPKKADPRLDPYRRLPSPVRKSRVSSTTYGKKNEPQLEKKTKAEDAVTEEMICEYSNLEIGMTLKMIGQPKELFRNSKRILDLEKVIIVHENFDNDHDEEIRFRNQLKDYRNRIYNQPFRLSNAWPESARLFNDTHSQIHVDAVDASHHQSRHKEKETKRLKLVPISKLQPNQITFANYLNYLTHYIITKYGQDSPNASSKMVNFQELKEQISSKSTKQVKLFEEFFIEDIFGNKLDEEKQQHDAGIQELNEFIERLTQQESQEEEKGQGENNKTIFLTEGEDLKNFKRTRQGIIRRSMQELVNQGTIIISPFNEAGFTLPNVYSLAPKIIQIILDHSSTTAPVSSHLILHHLKRDQLWKFVTRSHVETCLKELGFILVNNQDTWSLP